MDERQKQYVLQARERFHLLLEDARFLEALARTAGTSGLAWKQGTETWDDARLLAANAVLYATGRLKNHDGIRYFVESRTVEYK